VKPDTSPTDKESFSLLPTGSLRREADTKDVAQLTGRSYDAAKRLVRRAREAAGKPAGALVSVQDFCQLTGLDEAEVSRAINGPLSR
jgi:hypothetical protein